MNVKELKELASEWTEGKVMNIAIVDAILADEEERKRAYSDVLKYQRHKAETPTE